MGHGDRVASTGPRSALRHVLFLAIIGVDSGNYPVHRSYCNGATLTSALGSALFDCSLASFLFSAADGFSSSCTLHPTLALAPADIVGSPDHQRRPSRLTRPAFLVGGRDRPLQWHYTLDPSRHIKMDPPLFDGSDAQSWVTRIRYYFDHIQLPDEQRLHYVVMLFSPPASDWVFSYRANNTFASWGQFLEDVRRRFDPNYFVNYIELITKLTQTGTLAEYHKDFESMLNHIQGVPESTLLPIYMGGLRQPLRNQVRFQHPSSVAAAMALAMEFDSATERTPISSRRPWTRRDFRSQSSQTVVTPAPPQSSGTSTTLSPSAHPRDFSKLPVVRLSAAEKAERNRLGLCWYYPDKWVTGHVCKTKFLAYMGSDDEDDAENAKAAPTPPDVITTDLSHMYGMDGRSRAASLELRGFLGFSGVCILVDTGSTHNFLHPRLAENLQMPLKAVRPFWVYVGNGQALTCTDMSHQAELRIQGHSFLLDLYILPVHGPDLILGLSWLRSLHRVTSDYDAGTLEFIREGRPICLRVQPRVPRQVSANTVSSIMLHHDGEDLFELVALPSKVPEPSEDQNFPPDVPPTVLQVLRSHSSVFTVLIGVPPVRAFDHRIHLFLNTKPVNVRPYRYPYFQKNEIERQVREMLEAGIIRKSCSAFSSPVLLIHKKDGSFRFCIDYRALNAVTIPDHFPIPTTDELFDELGAARFFTKLDL